MDPLAEIPLADPDALCVTAEVDGSGILLVVVRARTAAKRSKPVAPEPSRQFWRDALPASFSRTADMVADAVKAGLMKREGHGIRVLPHQTSVFDEAIARHLKLPELCPHPFGLRCALREDGGRVLTVSVTAKEPPFLSGAIDGALVRFRPRTVYRAGARIAEMLSVVNEFNAASAAAQRQVYRRLDDHLDRGLLDMLWDGRKIAVFQAGAMGIDAVRPGLDDVRLDPVLFSGMPRGPEDEEPLPLLADHLQSSFVTAFDAGAGGRRSYRISDDAAVVVDGAVEECLRVVKSLRRKPLGDRLEFLRDPGPRLAKAMKSAGHEAPLIAHGRYAPHVRGIGYWEAPTFPYLSHIETEWLPEKFVVILDTGAVTLTSEQVHEFYEAVEAARSAGETDVLLLDRAISIRTAMDVWDQIRKQVPEHAAEAQPRPERQEKPQHLSLILNDNFEEVTHVSKVVPRTPHGDTGSLLARLAPSTKLKVHQDGGTAWLVDRWTCGAPSALLADDMGIGKTLQLLVFADWLVRAAVIPSKDSQGLYQHPILVVVPATLIDVWRIELGERFVASSIGRMYEPTGAALRAGSGTDIAGRMADFHQQPVTITTYEMVAEHLLVYGAVCWSAVVFDEIQRLKDPATQLRHAASGLNAGFMVGATGTPIENRIEDLWSLVDAISPGRLGALRDFSRVYSDLEIARLRELSVDLLGPDLTIAPDAPPLMLRRFKEDVLDGLPAKLLLPQERRMPKEQADAYAKAVRHGKMQSAAGVREAALNMVNDVRRISLHPDGLSIVDVRSARSLSAWVQRSARTSLSFDIIDDIRSRQEKVLIYLDDLAIQHVVAQAIHHRFGIPLPKIINGTVTKKRRTEIVKDFQGTDDGFVPIILSTRVGGVGLHMTAANHVLHGSRWWNPALEDQCNDRVHRMGQERVVRIHMPMSVYPDDEMPSFDRLNAGLLADKRLLAREVLIPPMNGREGRMIADRLRGAQPMAVGG